MQTEKKSHESKRESNNCFKTQMAQQKLSASAFDSYTKNTAQEAQSFLI